MCLAKSTVGDVFSLPFNAINALVYTAHSSAVEAPVHSYFPHASLYWLIYLWIADPEDGGERPYSFGYQACCDRYLINVVYIMERRKQVSRKGREVGEAFYL